jgi:hypothetical protein
VRKYSKEYWEAWRKEYCRGHDDGYFENTWNPPKKYNMFYEAYCGGYHCGQDERERADGAL